LFSDVQLTGINQDMVDGKPHIEEVLQVQWHTSFSLLISPARSLTSVLWRTLRHKLIWVTESFFCFVFYLQKFDDWMQKEILSQNATFTFVMCGDWDLKTMWVFTFAFLRCYVFDIACR
jgi:hypothetical protein